MYQILVKNIAGVIAIAALTACGASQAPAPVENPNIATAKQWVTAGAAGKAEAMTNVQENMADDGMLRSGPHKLDSAISAPRGYAAILATY